MGMADAGGAVVSTAKVTPLVLVSVGGLGKASRGSVQDQVPLGMRTRNLVAWSGRVIRLEKKSVNEIAEVEGGCEKEEVRSCRKGGGGRGGGGRGGGGEEEGE